MANIQEYIDAKLSKFNFEISTIELDVILLDFVELIKTSEITNENLESVKKVIVKIIPELFLVPEVSEGQFSFKRDTEGLKAYLKILCDELGIPNPLTPKIKFTGDIW